MGEREYYKDPEYKKKQSEIQKKRLEDPENRKKNKIILDKNRNTKKDPVTGRFMKRNVQAQEK